MWVVELSSEEQ